MDEISRVVELISCFSTKLGVMQLRCVSVLLNIFIVCKVCLPYLKKRLLKKCRENKLLTIYANPLIIQTFVAPQNLENDFVDTFE